MRSQAATPEPNISFTEFHNKIHSLFSLMDKSRREIFKKTVGTYYKQREPKAGWAAIISSVIAHSETKVDWPESYLGEIRQGRAQTTRTIACYYYLHYLTHDLSFANAVDEVVFRDQSPGERTFAKAHDGRPVFQLPHKAVQKTDASWKSALNQWAYERLKNEAANGLFASLSIERTQGGDTREPVALLAEVHIRPAYEHESGIELQFKSVDIELKCSEGAPSEIDFSPLKDQIGMDSGYKFQLQGTQAYQYITLTNDEAGLDGTYISGTLGIFHPNSESSELSATLSIRRLTTNAIFPEDISSMMKRQIIKRIAEKAMLPSPNEYGHILLHTLRYQVRAVGR